MVDCIRLNVGFCFFLFFFTNSNYKRVEMSFSTTNGALSYAVILDISSCQITDAFKQEMFLHCLIFKYDNRKCL